MLLPTSVRRFRYTVMYCTPFDKQGLEFGKGAVRCTANQSCLLAVMDGSTVSCTALQACAVSHRDMLLLCCNEIVHSVESVVEQCTRRLPFT
jgi:hypothetical protein